MNVWRAVRCCCKPQTIFGFMSVEENAHYITVAGHDFKIMRMSERTDTTRSYLTDKISPIPQVKVELAINSDDHPIEFWRKQEGFMEVKDD